MSEIILRLQKRLRRTRSAYLFIEGLTGLLYTMTNIFVVGLFVLALNMLFDLPSEFRIFLDAVFFLSTVGTFFWQFFGRLLRGISYEQVAILYERTYPELEDILISAWQLLKRGDWKEKGYSGDIVRGIGEQAISRMVGKKGGAVLPVKWLERSFRSTILSGLLFLVLFTAFPALSNKAIYFSTNPFVEIPRKTETVLYISPGDSETVKYSDFIVRILADGAIPETVTMTRRFERGKPISDEIEMMPDSNGIYWKTLKEVRQSFEYQVKGGDYTTNWYSVSVLDKPKILELNLTYIYPSYTGLGTEKGERNNGNVDALRGTKIDISARSSKELKSAHILFGDGRRLQLEVEGKEIRGGFTVQKDDTYQIIVTDDEDFRNPNPIKYEIYSRTDGQPTVRITIPGMDVDLTEEMKLPLQSMARDDFGFSAFYLHHFVNSGDTIKTRLEFSAWGEQSVVVELIWDLGPLNLLPEDVVSYWIEAWDNDRITGPKRAKSRVFAARFPSIDEIVEEVSQEQNIQREDLETAIEETKELSEKIKDIAREFRKEQQMEYEKREDLKGMMQEQQKILENLEDLSQRLDQSIEKIQEHKMAAMEIVEKMQEIQDLLQDIATPEMREAMEKMREAMQNMDMEQLKQAMQDFEMNQEELLENLDRTLELLKRVQMEQKLSQLMEMTEKALEEQNNISENMDENPDEQKRRQDAQSDRLEAMEKSMQDLAEMMKEFDDTPKEMADSMASDMSEKQMPQMSQNISQQMNSQKKSAKKNSQKLSENLSEMKESLSKLQQKMNENLQKELTQKMTKTSRKLNHLSKKQEDLLNRSCNGASAEEMEEIAREQLEVAENLQKVQKEIADIAGQTMFLPPATSSLVRDALNESRKSMEELSNRSCHRASGHQRSSMAKMNQAAAMMMSSMNKMCNSSSCPSGSQSMMEQMQSMCQGQQSLNSQSMPLLQGGGQQGGLTPQQMAQAQRLAAEQEALRKSLEQLSREMQGQNELLGRFDKTMEQMQQVSDDLSRGTYNERTMKNQERILSRMLDAQRSLEKREYSRKREGRTAEDVVRRSPPPLPEDLGERKEQLQRDLLEVLSQPYPGQYEGAIREYFEKLQSVEIQE